MLLLLNILTFFFFFFYRTTEEVCVYPVAASVPRFLHINIPDEDYSPCRKFNKPYHFRNSISRVWFKWLNDYKDLL